VVRDEGLSEAAEVNKPFNVAGPPLPSMRSEPFADVDLLPIANPTDPGLATAILDAPPLVRAFFLHEPSKQPWRYYETSAERRERKQAEEWGAWTG
jgi:hypothetical protein